MGVTHDMVGVAQNGVSLACLSRGRGFLLNSLGPTFPPFSEDTMQDPIMGSGFLSRESVVDIVA